ncbi:DNA methyltransferase [Rosettibacter firmus]|uniref:DNA methyltransferase n=1 Tax=Rosettibacter firmus TaxID=3111522 RepID=UPI00336BB5E9
MTKEQKFYQVLQDVFIGAKVEGTGGFVNLMKIKSNYYKKIEEFLKADVEKALEKYPSFRDELFDKLYSFFSRYFTESGSIYFNSTPFHNNAYEKVYTNEKDVVLFWKTQMLYYVKTDRIFRSLEIEVDNYKFFFDVSNLEHKKANEKRNLIYELKEIKEDKTIHLNVYYSERGRVTKTDDIIKNLKKNGINIQEDLLERAFRIFERQSEVDFFINKNAKAFLQEQFKLWSYQYFWDGAKEWTVDRVNELQILKDIAFKIIDFISQFEDELVKIWNKPKFVKNSNYVITLDKLFPSHRGDEGVFYSPSVKGWQTKSDGVVKWYELPYNPNLKERARELRKAGNLSEVLLWQRVKGKQFLGLDFDRQKIIGNYIVDFFVKDIGVVIEIDGGSHNDKIEYDRERDEYLQSLGLKVIHILDEDVKTNLDGVMEYLREELTPLTPLQEGNETPLTPLKEGNDTQLTPMREGKIQEGNLVQRILKHPNIHLQIKEWQELGIVDENFKVDDIFETDLIGKHLSKKYEHLPIDTKYFKDLELEILSLFDDLDKSLDGWLIKSENYQALNTILPKFKEKVQTIYIDPPFNLDSSDQFMYRTNYKDASWATLLENRLRIAKEWLNEKGSIFVRCDYNGNWIVRCLMDEIFERDNFRNEIEINRTKKIFTGVKGYNVAIDSLFFYTKGDKFKFYPQYKQRGEEQKWLNMHSPGERRPPERVILGRLLYPPKGRHWTFIQETIDRMIQEGRIRIKEDSEYVDLKGNIVKGMPQYLTGEEELLDSNWTDIPGYSQTQGFPTENSEILLKRVIKSTSNESDLVMDFFLGSGTTTAVAHKLGRKWIGIEMGEHFYSVVLPRMKKVLAYDKSGISKELKTPRQTSSDTPLKEGNETPIAPLKEGNYYNGGGFFKYYELEQYEEALANVVYEDYDIFIIQNKNPYVQYVFLKDEKMLKALEIDYENNKVKVDLSKLYENIDIAETLSNLTGKWIKKISDSEVEFEDGTKINTKDLDYKLIKPLIWWE